MDDRALLEAAARAAGIEVTAVVADGIPHRFGGGYWNPLTDDADAFRLAVKLRMVVNIGNGWAEALTPDETFTAQETGPDWYANTRRAVTRAAAQIGSAALKEKQT